MFKTELNNERNWGYDLKTKSKIIGYCEICCDIFWIIYQALRLPDSSYSFLDTEYRDGQKIYLVTSILITVISFAFTFLMLRGVNKEKASFLVPWLIFRVIYVLFELISTIPYLTINEIDFAVIIDNMTIAIFYVITSVLYSIIILIVYKYYRQLRGEQSSNA